MTAAMTQEHGGVRILCATISLYLGTDNKLYYPTKTRAMGSCRDMWICLVFSR